MLGLRDQSPAETWTASIVVDADPSDVLEALTDPGLIERWAPVGFDVEELSSDRLEPGGHARVRGTLAGLGATFDVDVSRADREALELHACGPVSLEVAYRFSEGSDGTGITAEIRLERRRGMTAQLMRGAVSGLLSGGALCRALARLEREIPDRELALA